MIRMISDNIIPDGLEDTLKFQLEKEERRKLKMLGQGRIMRRWKSSLWKLLWNELVAYTFLFLMISLIYREALDKAQQKTFEALARWCGKMYSELPLTFLLGFYVSLVVKRWWEQYCFLPWPDSLALSLRGHIRGGEDLEQNRVMRRTVLRYCLLSYILCIRRVSSRLRRRFPSTQEIIKSGLMRPDEAARIGEERSWEMYDSNWGMPIKWSNDILYKGLKKGNLEEPMGYNIILNDIKAFREGLCQVQTYGHIPVPLVYTQVVHIAVYFYFALALIGEQWLIRRPIDVKWETAGGGVCPATEWPTSCHQRRNQGDELDLYYPIFMTVKFLFYFGWLKVAQTLYNPFGEDDEDFQLNDLIQRHLRVALAIVDDVEEPPSLEKDIFWSQTKPVLQDIAADNILARNTEDTEAGLTGKEDQVIEVTEFKTVQEQRDL